MNLVAPNRRESGARCALAAVLVGSGLLKLVSGHAAHVDIPGLVYVAGSLAELTLAALLASRWWRFGIWGTLVIAAAGASHALLLRPESCGCVGSWIRSSWRFELVLASVVGALGVLALPCRNP
jgi:hypothetical protein